MKMFTPEKPPVPPEFEKLREMERFSDEMFNRIISFQEKKHKAWDATSSFDERIKSLPLHALIFSNPDRDPEQFAQTIAPFYPLREEMRQIAHYARLVSDAPVVCDMHAQNGFVGSLLAREGVKVIGLRDPEAKPNQIVDFYDPACYELRTALISDIDFEFDVALSTWMPSEKNLTPEIIKHKPKLIIFIHTDHIDEDSGKPQTGTKEAFTELPSNYKPVVEWSIVRPADLLHDIWPELTPSLEESRHVIVYADTPYHDIDVTTAPDMVDPYDWEYELDMALTAIKAKDHLREQGYPV
ncbi:MAG: hypothetical protein ACE5EH_01950 [Gammaproteobacteria bacterium]